jgi:hypothetical protein
MNESIYKKEFIPYAIKWGRIINLYAVVISFLPVAVIMWYYGYTPGLTELGIGLISTVSVVGVMWFSDPIAFFPILGIPGIYMAHLSGNTANLKVPVAAIAQDAAGVELGSDEGGIVVTISCAVSAVVCLLALTVACIGGSALLSLLPDTLTTALGYVLPALHAALLARMTKGQPKMLCSGVVLALVGWILLKLGAFNFIPGSSHTYVVTLLAVFGSILVARLTYKKKEDAAA